MKAVIFLAIVTLAEASIGIFVKLVGSDVPIFTLNFYRVFFAALFLAIAVPFVSKDALKYPKRNTRDILIIGALIAAQISLFNIAMSLAPVANVVIFWSVAPFFVFIFSTLFLNERPRPVHILIFFIAIVSVALAKPVSFDSSLWGSEQLGNLIALIDGAIYAALVTYLRWEGKTESNVDIFWFMFVASVYLSPALLVFGSGDLLSMSSAPAFSLSVPVFVWVLALGVLSTGVAFLFISLVLHTLSANIYSLVDIIVSPIVAAVLAYAIFFEMPTQQTVLGGVILLTSGFLLTYLRIKDASKQNGPPPVPRVLHRG